MTNLDPLDLPPSQEPSDPKSVVDLHGVVRLMLEKSWLIVSCVILAVVAAAVYVQRAPRVYEALTTVEVEQEDAKIVSSQQVVAEDMRGLEILNTVAQKLQNASLLQQVLETNHLLPPEGTVVASGSKGLTREEAIKMFAKNVKSTLRRNSRLIDLTVRNTDPRLAARMANNLVEDYLGQDALAQKTTTGSANIFLKDEVETQRKKLEASEQALQDYRKKVGEISQVGSISLESNQDIMTPQLKEISERLTQSKADRMKAEGAYQDSTNMSTNIEALMAYPQVATDPDVVQISSEVERQEDSFIPIRLRYREHHPKYKQAAETLEALKKQLATVVLRARARMQESLRIVYKNALITENGLQDELKAKEAEAMQLSDAAIQFKVLSHQMESDKAKYDMLMSRYGETAVSEKITPERIRVVQPALVPELPASPKVNLIFALALFGGLGFGLGFSFVLSAMNTSFRTVDEVEQYLSLPVLGTVPRLPRVKGEPANKLVAIGDTNSAGAEVFRTLRATVTMLGREKDRRTFLFTSSLPGEGKTFGSLNFAASLAQQGLRTLLIDLDLRRPMVEEFFTAKRHHMLGATDYFLGRNKFDELCQPHEEVSNLFWMPSGSAVPNPSELLTQIDFPQLLQEGLARFDRVVIDTAPLLPVSDTLLLASKVQTVVLVVHGYKTSRKGVERAVQMLRRANAPISGILLNMLPNRRFGAGYYYSYYHGYGYGSYGKKGEAKTSVSA